MNHLVYVEFNHQDNQIIIIIHLFLTVVNVSFVNT
jgi:hypothetical protein